AVTQEHSTRPRIVDLANLLHVEHVDVELCRLLHILSREGDVLDLRHRFSPLPRRRGVHEPCLRNHSITRTIRVRASGRRFRSRLAEGWRLSKTRARREE